MMFTALSSKGQVVLPKEVREMLGIRPGTKFRVEVKEGKIIFVPIKVTVGATLWGKYKDFNLLEDLLAEHRSKLSQEEGR